MRIHVVKARVLAGAQSCRIHDCRCIYFLEQMNKKPLLSIMQTSEPEKSRDSRGASNYLNNQTINDLVCAPKRKHDDDSLKHSVTHVGRLLTIIVRSMF
jgi:hypothetical protein